MRKYASLQVLESWQVPARPGRAGLRKAAHRVSFDYEPRAGYLYVRSRMISSRTNDNHDTFPAPEIEKGYKTFLGKPVFVNHHNANHRRSRGVIVAVALHRDRNPDGTPDTWVEGLMEIDAVRFPKLAKAILAGKVNRTSMGVDVDWSRCSACGNKATSPAEYCSHLPAMKGKKIRKRNQATGKIEEKLIHEICAGLSFFENSLLVEDPADPTAVVLDAPDARGLGKTAAIQEHFTHCMNCGVPLENPDDPAAARAPGDWRHHGYPGLCMNCAIGPLADDRQMPGTPGKPMPLFPGGKGGYSGSPADAGWRLPGERAVPGEMRPWRTSDSLYRSQSAKTASLDQPHPGRIESGDGCRLNCTYGSTHCLACGDQVKINLHKTDTDSGGWHHYDGMKRDHLALPADPEGVMASIPGQLAMKDQARQHVREVMHRQFEQLSGHPLPRSPRGDEDRMPPDPFTAAKKREGGDHPFFKEHPVSKQHIIDAYHDTTSDEKALGDRWYSDAHHVAKGIAGGDAAKGAALLSAYSPQTAWPVNMFNASRAAQGDPPGPGSGAMGIHQKSAMRILAGEHHSEVLKAPKTSAFAHLIEHGGDTREDEKAGKHKVVIDRHALSVAAGHRLTKAEGEKAPIKQPQHYEHVARLYRDAAHDLSEATGRKISPHQVQAATWLRQIRKNQDEDRSGEKSGGKGRVNMQENSKTRWTEHHRHHHPGAIPEENMHHHGRRAVAYGETRVPSQVDTLRMEECPVCGEHDVWSGDRCPVCGFIVPPSLFRDPDVNKAHQVRDELDQAGEVVTGPDGMEQTAPATGPDGQIGSGDDADSQLMHPDQVAPDGTPGVQGEGGPVPAADTDGQPPAGEEQAEGEAEEEQGEEDQEQGTEEQAEGQQLEQQGEEDQLGGDPELPAPDLECPACGAHYSTDTAAQPGTPCPACRQGSLQPVGGPQKDQEDPDAEDEDEDEGEEMPGSKTGAALAQAQARRIAELSAQNEVLTEQLRFLGSAAGVDRHLAAIRQQVLRRYADMLNPASPVPDPPEAPPTETTEQALQPAAMDDPSRPGTTPGANTGVPARQTTTAITPGVEDQTPPATNLIDVTAPVQGTNPSQDGGVPISQRRIETDVRIDPDPLKAHGPGIGGMGDNGAAFPWLLDAQQPQQGQGQRAAALHGGSPLDPPDEAAASRRTFASIRLAKLRVQAGLAQGEELSVAERIEKDAALPTTVIEHEIGVLSRIPQPGRQQPPMQRAGARSVPSLASVGASSSYAPAAADYDLDASDLFD